MKSCLNCQQPLQLNYCANCGQKASTHRFSLKHLFMHDVLHEVLHLDKGIFTTTKQLLTTPGYSIRQYIEGRRMKLMNPLTLLLLLLAVNYFVSELSGIKLVDIVARSETATLTQKLDDFNKEYPKVFVLITIPVYALVTFIFFRKGRQNFAEHLVLNTYRACGEMMISIFFLGIAAAVNDKDFAKMMYWLMFYLAIVYSVWLYWQYFRPDFRNRVMLWIRCIMANLVIILVASLVMMVTILVMR
jgi:hypothetical protein